MKKLTFSLFVVAIATTSMFASNTQVDGIWYDFNSSKKTASVTYGGSSYYDYSNEYSGSVVIPETVTYNNTTYSVTTIGSSAFDGCYGLTSVTISNSVTTIGDYAFYRCTGLTTVTIPNSVTTIGYEAFYDCTSLPVENNIRYADTYLIEAVDKTLSTYTIKDGTTWIGRGAFSSCSNLTSITIPNSVTSIGDRAFYECINLEEVNGCENVIEVGEYAFKNTLWFLDQPNGFLYIGKVAYKYKGTMPKDTQITIKDGTLAIAPYAFDGCSGLTSITIPNSVTTIGSGAFMNCHGLTSITVPNSVTTIGNSAFAYCSGLTSITIPDSVTTIGDYAFEGCDGLTSITVPNSVTTIGSGAFKGCYGLTSITVPNSVTTIGNRAFYECSGLTTVTIPNSVITIGAEAFYECSGLTTVTIPYSVTTIGSSAFRECTGLTSVTINSESFVGNSDNNIKNIFGEQVKEYILGDSVTTIGNRAFYECSGLTTVTIPYSVTTIGKNAFEGCSGLTSITIPNSVTSIGNYAFSKCKIKKIVCEIEKPITISANVFDTYNATLYVFAKSVNRYKLADVWKKFGTILPIGAEEIIMEETTSAEATNQSVTISWQKISEADSYQLVILKDGQVVRTLVFNAKGELISNIHNAPARNMQSATQYATTTANGFKFTITGLEYATKYDYHISVQNSAQEELCHFDGAFATKGLSYKVTTSAENGMVVGGGNYDYGTKVELTAIPNEHYHFVQWLDGVKDNPRIITVISDTTYSAIFAIDQFTISVVAENGSVSGVGTYDYGTEVTLTAIPNEGYEFVNWSNGITYNPYTFIVEQDVDLTANFKKVDTGWQDVYRDTKVSKFFHNGSIVIERNGNLYNAQGNIIK